MAEKAAPVSETHLVSASSIGCLTSSSDPAMARPWCEAGCWRFGPRLRRSLACGPPNRELQLGPAISFLRGPARWEGPRSEGLLVSEVTTEEPEPLMYGDAAWVSKTF